MRSYHNAIRLMEMTAHLHLTCISSIQSVPCHFYPINLTSARVPLLLAMTHKLLP